MNTTVPATIDAKRETHAARLWGGIVVGLLGLQVAIGFFSVFCATSDRRDGVLPDYYSRGLDWDRQRAAEAASVATGWEAAVDVAGTADLYGVREVTVTLTDADGTPLSDATVRGTLFAHSEASRVAEVVFVADRERPGVYRGSTEMRRGGLWTVALDVERDGRPFVHREDLYLASN